MMAAAPMELAQTAQPPSDPSSAPYPRWVMLQRHLKIEGEGSFCSTSGDANNTLAAARTRIGLPIQVSLSIAEPPAVSSVCLQIPGGLDAKHSQVVAADGDSVLIEVSIEIQGKRDYMIDHFVYNAGAAAADPPRPPSLSLFPDFRRVYNCTGLVRRGDDELVVAQLLTLSAEKPETEPAAELIMFCAGEWTVRRLQIMFRNASEVRKLPSLWDGVVPVGDGLLCWVDLWQLGVVICDVFEETPRLQYLPLPMENICGEPSNRNVCATAGGDALKFVNVFPRCCCGGAGASSCKRSCNAYTIETWTMRIGNGDEEWVKDSIIDSSELWALDSYKGLRCFPLDHPVVSMDQPELICFWLHEPPEDRYWWYSDTTEALLMVNTRSKTIHSVSRYEHGLYQMGGLIPSNVSNFFNSYLSSGSDATLTGQSQVDIERSPPVIVDERLIKEDDDGSNPTKLASFAEPSVQASEFFEAFQEIPSYGLDHDELKVYRILSSDNCRRFKSLIRLPKNLRKDWLLMEIKANKD